MIEMCLQCGDLLVRGVCPTCTTADEMAIIEGRLPKKTDSEPRELQDSGKHSLPIGLRDDVRRRGSGKGET